MYTDCLETCKQIAVHTLSFEVIDFLEWALSQREANVYICMYVYIYMYRLSTEI